MAKSRVARVTPNMLRCIEELRAALKKLPAGESRTTAKGALDYLEQTFAGEAQPNQGRACTYPRIVIR